MSPRQMSEVVKLRRELEEKTGCLTTIGSKKGNWWVDKTTCQCSLGEGLNLQKLNRCRKFHSEKGVITRNNSATTSKSARKQNFEECWAYSSWIQNQKSRTRPESITRCSKGGIHKRLTYKVKYRYLIDLAKWNAEWSRSHGFPLSTFLYGFPSFIQAWVSFSA